MTRRSKRSSAGKVNQLKAGEERRLQQEANDVEAQRVIAEDEARLRITGH